MKRLLVVPWLGIVVFAACADARSPADVMSDAEADVDAIRFERAMARYDSARAVSPEDVEAHRRYAELTSYFMRFAESAAAWERVLELEPGDPAAWDGYVLALLAAGGFETDRRYTEKLLQVLPAALRSAGRRPDVYDHAQAAAAQLGALQAYSAILADYLAANPGNGVSRHHFDQARIMLAEFEGGGRGPALRDSIGTVLDALASRHEGDAAAEASVFYRLAAGYDALGREAEAELWLARLESAPNRGVLADGLRFWRLGTEFEDRLGSADDDAGFEAALHVVERGMNTPRLDRRGAWVSQSHRAVLRRATASAGDDPPSPRTVAGMVTVADEPPGAALDPAVAERLFESAMEVVAWQQPGGEPLDALRAALYFGIEPGAVLEEAVRVEEALRTDRPGYLFAGYRGDEREQARQLNIDRARILRARALTQLGELEAAGRLFEELAGRSRGTRTLGEYGRHLLRAGRPEEALAAFVDAMAFGGSGYRPLAEEAAAAVGLSPETVDERLSARRPIVEEERERRALGARLEREAPDFAVRDQDGVEWRLGDLAGRIVVLKFWATWCGPCLAEFPHFVDLLREYEEDGEVVFLTVATAGSPRDEVAQMIEENGYAFPVLFDEQGLALDFEIQGYPTTLYIDRNGRIQFKRQGFSPSGYERGVARRIDALRGEVDQSTTRAARPTDAAKASTSPGDARRTNRM